MTYKHYFKTVDPRQPQIHVEVDSTVHIQDLSEHHAAIAAGDLASSDAAMLVYEPHPERLVGREVASEGEQVNTVGRASFSLGGKAVVYCFEKEDDRDAFCNGTRAIEAKLYQQTKVKDVS